jgi:hypothetical protein
LKLGDTFVIRNSDHQPPFVWVVASDPDPTGRVVIVPIRPIPRHGNCDMTCVIESRYHRRVHVRSFVDYEQAKWVAPEHQEIVRRHSEECSLLDDSLLKELMKGAGVSLFTPDGARKHIATHPWGV